MSRRQLFVLIATILGSGIVFLDGTIVTLALPKIGANLHAGFSSFQWIVDSYLLSLSALILLGGSLGDIFGRKKVYLTGLVGFGLTSLLCALSPNVTVLILLRIVQGIFGALLVPGALSIINTNFPKKLRGQAIGKWTAFGGISSVLGPLVGGTILDVTSWRWIFFINLPLVILCLIFGLSSIEESRDTQSRKVDSKGALIAVLSLAGMTYGLIQGPSDHWKFTSIGSLLIGLISAVLFIKFESTKNDPLVDLSLFKSRNFSGANIMTFAMYGALSGFTFSLVIYLQTHLAYSSIKAGFSLLPVSILMFLFAGRVGKLSGKYGPRLFMTIGPFLAAIGMLYLYFLKVGAHYITGILPGAILFAIGLVLTVAPLTTTVMTSVNESSSGIASGINNAVSRVAGLIVIAILGIFGANDVYHFAIGLSAGLAAVAGIISFTTIRNISLSKKVSPAAATK